jgi:hypothetical protein
MRSRPTPKGSERPQLIAETYGVSWKVILTLPPNNVLREREARKLYPIRAGDRIAIPTVNAPSRVDHVQNHSSWLSRVIDSLVRLHPSYPGGVKYFGAPSGPPPLHQLPQCPVAPSSAEPVAYKTRSSRIGQKVILTSSIESSFEALLPYLPRSAVMTSGFRSDPDQVRIINEYYDEKKGDPAVTDVEQRRQWLKTEYKLIIAKVGSSPHRTGLAFDLSGANLDEMSIAVSRCKAECAHGFPVHSTIVERNQNCLHINLSG